MLVTSDLRASWRSTLSRPWSSLVIIVVQASGVALAVAMFALTDPYLFRSLPFPQADRLVVMYPDGMGSLGATAADTRIEDWQRRTDLFSSVGALGASRTAAMIGPGGAAELTMRAVSSATLDQLGVPLQGPGDLWRPRTVREEVPLVISPRAARRLQVSARGVSLVTAQDGTRFRVVGVLPTDFLIPQLPGRRTVDGVVPLDDTRVSHMTTSNLGTSGETLTLTAVLSPHVGIDALTGALDAAFQNGTLPKVRVRFASDVLTEGVRDVAVGAAAAGGLVLLATIFNIFNLLATRVGYRHSELATRYALGGRRGHLVRLVAADACLLGILGSLVGVSVAAAVLSMMSSFVPVEFVALGEPQLSGRVVMFALGCAALTTIGGSVLGLISFRSAIPAAKAGAPRGFTAQRITFRVLSIGTQSLCAGLLVVCAVMLLRSMVTLGNQDTGLSADALVVTVVFPSESGADLPLLVDQVLRATEAVPGVDAVGATNTALAVDGEIGGAAVRMAGRNVPAGVVGISGDYLEAAGIALDGPLRRLEDGGSAIVNRSFVAQCCGGGSVLGMTAAVGSLRFRVSAIASDAFERSLDRRPVPTMYIPLMPVTNSAGGLMIHFVVKARGDLRNYITSSLHNSIASVAPAAWVVDTALLGEKLWTTVNHRTFVAIVLILFGITAATMSIVSVAGVVALNVERRTKEIAIRIALGASRTDIRRVVGGQAAVIGGLGMAIGVGLGAWGSIGLRAFLYGIEPADITSIVLSCLVLLCALCAAALLASERALAIQPSQALALD